MADAGRTLLHELAFFNAEGQARPNRTAHGHFAILFHDAHAAACDAALAGEPWPLERIDTVDERARKAGLAPKALLRANKESGNIQLDSETQLRGVPAEAWIYKLGNRSALEWILDQHKEKTPKDPTIREKFNTYRFADHKEKVVDLLKRVTRVSVETMKIIDSMRAEHR